MITATELVFAPAAALGWAATVVLLRHSRRVPGFTPSVVMFAGASWWSTWGLVMALAPTPELARLAYVWLVPGFAVGAAAVLCHALRMSGRARRGRLKALLGLEPAVLVVVALVPGWHPGVVSATVTSSGGVLLVMGPVAWANALFDVALVVWAVALLLGARSRTIGGHRRPFFVSGAAIGLPVGSAIGALALVRDAHLVVAIASAGFLLTTLVWTRTLARRRVSAVPVAVERVLGSLGDGVLVIDSLGAIAFANPAARTLIERWGEAAPGDHWSRGLDPALVAVLGAGGHAEMADGSVLDVRVAELGPREGSVVTVRDVTEVEHLRAELAEQTVRDGLTGLHNRRYLDRVLPGLLVGSAGTQRVTAAMIDIDHFKEVNDRYGHAAGDRVLRGVARELSARLHAQDVLVRFGGEEFLALLPGAGAEEVIDRAQEWRAACAATRVPVGSGTCVVTVSIGLAEIVHGGTPDDLLRDADDALYRAKAGGRDRVVVARPVLTLGAPTQRPVPAGPR